MHRVVVAGAGYAGLPAAHRLARQTYRDEVEVVVLNDRDRFVERPRLHQLATGQRRRDLPLSRFLGGGRVRLQLGRLTAIERRDRGLRVRTDLGDHVLEYDTLVYALGSTVDRQRVPGVADHAVTLSDPAAALGVAERLREDPDARVVVCGGGLSGLEIAAEVAESHRATAVTLLTDGRLGSWLSDAAQAYLRRTLDGLGVTVRESTRVARVERGSVVATNGEATAYDVCVWAGGFTVPSLAADAGLAVDAQQRVVTDPTLRSITDPRIYAVGDAAAVPGPWGDALAMGCRTGGFTGPAVADGIAARLAGREPEPFRFRYVHECISLGRRRHVIQFLRADGTASARTLRGRPARLYKDLVLDGARLAFRYPGPLLPRRRHLVPESDPSAVDAAVERPRGGAA